MGGEPGAVDERRLARRRLSIRRLVVAVAGAVLSGIVGASLFGVGSASPVPRGPAIAEHVVIISLDGLRPDAIDDAGADTLKTLIRRGAYARQGRTVRPPLTLPGHTSMLTGLDSSRHRVFSNDHPRRLVATPTIFPLARDAGLATAMFYSKASLGHLADPAALDTGFGPMSATGIDFSPDRVAEAFAEAWGRKAFGLTFVHLREPDRTGHRDRWMSPAYRDAVRVADRAVARIVESLARAGVLEKTAIIVTADHGGIAGSKRHLVHEDLDNPEAVTIPWICVGPGVPAGLSIDRVVHVQDTAPTALVFLGIAVPAGFDGRPVAEVFRR